MALNSRAQALLWMGKDEEALVVLLSIPGPVLPELVEANTAWLARRPVWLFSSGPVGPAAPADPKELPVLREAIAPLDHRVFYGALDRHHLSIGERIVVGAVKAPDGDYRDWREIEAWADEIAESV